jgi:hypothetical protein
MPRYRIRLEDPDSDEFRITFVNAKSPEAAQEWAEQREREFCAHELSDEPEGEEDSPLARAKADAEDRGRPGMSLVIHEQKKPYKVVDVTLRDKRTSQTKKDRRP